MARYTCVDCGAVVEVPNLKGNPKRCADCRYGNALERTRTWKRTTRQTIARCTCLRCGAEFLRPAGTGMLPQYCSTECRRAEKDDRRRPLRRVEDPYPDLTVVCGSCNMEFMRSGRATTDPRCEACRAEMVKARNASYRERHPDRVEQSRAQWIERNPDYQPAAPTAEQLVQRRAQAVTYAAVRRARKLGLGYEEFEYSEIFERDGWTCYLCNDRVDPGLPWGDPMAAELDHIVPLSREGHHRRDNVGCTHAFCNRSKGRQLTDKRPRALIERI